MSKKETTTDIQQGMPSAHEELEVKRVMNRQFVTAPDKGVAWEEFCRKYLSEEENILTDESRQKSAKSVLTAKLFRWIAVGAVAIVILLVVFNWYSFDNSKNLFYEAKDEVAQITLTDVYGKTTVVKQQISMISQTDQRTVSDRNQNKSSISYKKILHLATSHGRTCEITLEDGTTIWLNDESSLDFPEHFSPTKREVMISGEAYFSVAKDTKRPFIVKGEEFKTRVLGTQFNIRSRKHDLSKNSSPITEITLVEGSISVINTKGMEQKLVPGEQYLIENGQWIKKEVDTYPLIQWRDGFFYFDQTPLGDILTDIGRWYNMNVVVEDYEIMEMCLHFVAEKSQTIEEVITALNMLKVAHFTFEDNKIIVSR